jgi:hypothetical protein
LVCPINKADGGEPMGQALGVCHSGCLEKDGSEYNKAIYKIAKKYFGAFYY